jgi:mitotic spindle assembly checkpoint protein MAD1
LQDLRTSQAEERAALERKLRTAAQQRGALEEQLEETREQLGTLERERVRGEREAEARDTAAKQQVEHYRSDADATAAALKATQQKLAKRDEEFAALEVEALRLRAQDGGGAGLDVLKREVSEQVAHIRKLETSSREQLAELQELRKNKQNIEKVEDQKRSLDARLRALESVSAELEEVRLRNDALERERNSWTSYLEQEASGEDMKFDSPEDLARAFLHERLEKVSLLDRIGAMQPELTVKDTIIRGLEDQTKKLQSEINSSKAAGSGTDSKAKARLERQRTLALKETELLRAQLKNLDADESENNPDHYSESQAKRIQELESLVDSYRQELDAASASLQSLDPAPAVSAGTKRPLDDANDERVGELLRKNRQLQDNCTDLQTRTKVLESELKAKSSQLSTIKSQTRHRILELKDNPTTAHSAVQQRTLDALRRENDTLRGQLAGSLPTSLADGGFPAGLLVPAASLDRQRLQIEDREATIASRDKSIARLKDVFRAKGLEFKEAVFSLLGWSLNFQPNGRVKAKSMFYPKAVRRRGESGEGEEHFIEFDGENGTMKVSGGPQSEFAKEIRGLIEFWVDGKGQVPCFLAAMTLEFFEKYGEEMGK